MLGTTRKQRLRNAKNNNICKTLTQLHGLDITVNLLILLRRFFYFEKEVWIQYFTFRKKLGQIFLSFYVPIVLDSLWRKCTIIGVLRNYWIYLCSHIKWQRQNQNPGFSMWCPIISTVTPHLIGAKCIELGSSLKTGKLLE